MRRGLPALLLAAALPACGGPEARPPARGGPNLALIVIDTLRADVLGCYGGAPDVSPELDALAGEGLLFEHVLAPSSWTRPSIGALLTGRYPRTLGLFREEGDSLPEEATTLAEHLRAHGYATFGATANPNVNSLFRFDQGFDEHVDSDVVFPFMPAGSRQETYRYGHSALPSARALLGRCLDWAAAAPGPAYVQLDLMEVHEHALQLRDDYRGLFQGRADRGYLAAVRQVSADLGSFVARLRALPGWEDALVVITSDHGESLEGEHPSVQAKPHGDLLYEQQLRVPLLLHRPGTLPPARIVTRARLLDLAPTLCELLGLPPLPQADGRSLVGLWDARVPAPMLPEAFVAETAWRTRDKLALTGPVWQLVLSRDGHPGAAPRELQRLGVPADGARTSATDSHRDLTAELERRLRAWEDAHPPAPRTPPRSALSGEARRQLEAIGYTGGG